MNSAKGLHETMATLVARRAAAYAERDAVRLSHHESMKGLTVDDYGGWLLLTDYSAQETATLRAHAEAALAALQVAGRPAYGAVSRLRPDNLSHEQQSAAMPPLVLAGQGPPDRWVVGEHGLKFEVSFTEAGFSTGLFLDMAVGRHWLGQHARGVDLLNLFSFTGAFSIAAARGGAASVIEVDASGKWLGWSQANQKRNGLADGTIRQRRNDAVAFVGRAESASCDMVICDPPSYARPKRGKRFTIREGYRDMGRHLVRVLRRDGVLLACCNHAQTTPQQFRKWLPRELTVTDWLPMPIDFAGADYLKIAVARRA